MDNNIDDNIITLADVQKRINNGTELLTQEEVNVLPIVCIACAHFRPNKDFGPYCALRAWDENGDWYAVCRHDPILDEMFEPKGGFEDE